MTIKDSILLKRTVCTAALVVLTGCLIANHALKSGVNYVPVLDNSISLLQTDPDRRVSSVDEPADSRQVLTMSFVGNCIVGSMLGSSAYGTFNELMETEGTEYFLSGASSVLSADDWTVCALGSVFSDGDYRPAEKSDGERTWYLSSVSGAEVLSSGSVEAVSLATDHTKDYGAEGYADTRAALEKAGITWGDDEKAVYLEKYGIRTGIYMCTLQTADDLSRILNWIEGASASCDMVVVYPHGHMGAEPDDQAVLEACCSMIDAGADLVLGTHSTVLYDPISYGNGVIVPSLGSFLSGDTRFPEMETGVFQVDLVCSGGDMESWSWKMIPFLAYDEPWQPVPAQRQD
ncbi:MAG: CapA family protein [Clostridia bacterium]|nr:CapA family protein [Clostridia bacterium]